jgi:hypothetical protein
MIAASKDFRDLQSEILLWAGEVWGAEEAVFVAVLGKAVRAVEGAREEPNDGVGHDEGRELAAGEDVVADAEDVGGEELPDAIVEAFVVPAKEDDSIHA